MTQEMDFFSDCLTFSFHGSLPTFSPAVVYVWCILYSRHMVASRDIKAGETIMEDSPLTYGPLSSSSVSPLCLGCYKSMSRASTSVKCPRCGWTLCSLTCADQPQHRDFECQLFCDLKVSPPSDGSDVAYSCISPIRALMLREKDPEKFKMIWSLMSHNEVSRWKRNI